MESTVEEQNEEIKSFPEPVLTREQWNEVKRAVEAGMEMREASNRFSVDYQTIKVRAWREGWLHDSKIKALAEQVKAKEAAKVESLKPIETEGQKRAETASQAIIESFESHRSGTLLNLARMAGKGISRAMQADLPIENWQDAKIVADIAMKLHNVGQENVNVNVLVGGDGGFDGPAIEIEADFEADDMDE